MDGNAEHPRVTARDPAAGSLGISGGDHPAGLSVRQLPNFHDQPRWRPRQMTNPPWRMLATVLGAALVVFVVMATVTLLFWHL